VGRLRSCVRPVDAVHDRWPRWSPRSGPKQSSGFESHWFQRVLRIVGSTDTSSLSALAPRRRRAVQAVIGGNRPPFHASSWPLPGGPSGWSINQINHGRNPAAARSSEAQRDRRLPPTPRPWCHRADCPAVPPASWHTPPGGSPDGSVANSAGEPSVGLRRGLVRRRTGTVQRRRLPEPSCRGRRSSEPVPSSSSPSPRSQPRFVGRFGSCQSRAPARSGV